MDIQKLKRGCVLAIVCYIVLAVAFAWIAGDQMHFVNTTTDMVTAAEPVGEIVQGVELRQPFTADADEVHGVSLMLSTYARANTSTLTVQIVDKDGDIAAQKSISCADIADNAVRHIAFDEPAKITPNEQYELVLSSSDAFSGNAVTAWQGSTMSATRAEVELTVTEDTSLRVNGQPVAGVLVYSLSLRENLWFGQVYWYLVAVLGLCLVAFVVHQLRMAQKNRNTMILRLVSAFQRYGYLMRQLISRDFKTKYKRSVLGIFWSFLNPLLTMTVQYIVFSTLFKSDIPNFPLYLLTGIVCFNFFSEATGMALQSIVGNASLITKVYVPKYIYPVSRVLSSTINLLLSLIPLFAVMLFTGAPFSPALLLLPFGIICLLAFCIGVGLVLSTVMVFFRDTQFLWGIVSMLWMYVTPIFYPESIIPAQFMTLYKCNPLYHIIRFIRIILMDGVSPEPKAYLLCIIASFVPLVIGAIVFKKNQDKFVLNL